MTTGMRVAVLTTRDVIRHGVRGMLDGLPVPVHFAATLDRSLPADVILVDATGTTDECAHQLELVTDDETAPVVLLTARDPAPGFEDWSRPVHAYVSVSATDAEMVAVVASAIRASVLTRASRAVASPRATSGLSERETEILMAIASGRSNDEIAGDMFLSVNTVKTHVRTAYRKIGVSTRPNAILWALGHGLGPEGVAQVEERGDDRWAAGAEPDLPGSAGA